MSHDLVTDLDHRASIVDYLDARIAKYRASADQGLPGWAMDKHDAGLLERLRDEIVNEFDIVGNRPWASSANIR